MLHRPEATPYPRETRRGSAVLLVWLTQARTNHRPECWALKSREEVGITENLSFECDGPEAQVSLSNWFRDLAESQQWGDQNTRQNFLFKSGMTIGQILDIFGVI
jgi:hypothetical protein